MWTSLNGQHQFEGAFVSLLGEDLTLKGADEKEVTVPLTSLNEESRARGLALASGAIRLRDGFLWYYETPAYRLALFKGNTVAVIQFLDQGKAIVFPPIKLEMVHHEVNGTEFLYKGFTEMAAPLADYEGGRRVFSGSGVRFLYPELPGGDMPEARFSLSFK